MPEVYDVILRNARLIDGRQTPAFEADLAVRNGRITEIAPKIAAGARREVDVGGQVVTPGFIDIHTHSDMSMFLSDSAPLSKLCQGVTTEIVGNCGISPVPLSKRYYEQLCDFYHATVPNATEAMELIDLDTAQYATHVRRCSPSTNYGVLIGHGTLRGCVMGFDMRPPDEAELSAMEHALSQELEQGAFGLSLGLIYPPSSFAAQRELVALARVLRRHDALLTVHLRNEGPRVFEAVDEMLAVARISGVRLQLSHLKLMGRAQWGRAGELLERIEAARHEGIDVACDQYPYPASSTGLSALLPGWALDGGVAALLERLREPAPALLLETKAELERRGGADCVLVVDTQGRRPDAEGKTLAELAGQENRPPEQTAAKLLLDGAGGVNCIYFSMDEGDVKTILRDMNIAVGSDGSGYDYSAKTRGKRLHPRNFGTFPRFFQLAREGRLLTPEQAVYKATGLPAARLGLTDRGTLEVGKAADLAVLDWEAVADRSTYLEPAVRPVGIVSVLVAGEFVLEKGVPTDASPGAVLLHNSSRDDRRNTR